MEMIQISARRMSRVALAAGIVGIGWYSTASAAPSAEETEAQARTSWRESIVRTQVPYEGCFHAAYPNKQWESVACGVAPNRPFRPHKASDGLTVGDGDDYAAEVTGLMSSAVGSFPRVSGVTSEKNFGEANNYSLQLNSNFMTTAACNGPNCLSWQQFIYSTGNKEGAVFMQYWLIEYGSPCPKGWIADSPDCYKNSASVPAPNQVITQLANLTVSGSAVLGGVDTVTFTTETDAYSATGPDTVVDLATGWNESEFNVIGNGDGTKARFNAGSSITVKIAVSNGTSSAPTCVSDAGTTAETNNLTLGPCKGFGGSSPSIEFIEAN
jgi:hypothetical protein